MISIWSVEVEELYPIFNLLVPFENIYLCILTDLSANLTLNEKPLVCHEGQKRLDEILSIFTEIILGHFSVFLSSDLNAHTIISNYIEDVNERMNRQKGKKKKYEIIDRNRCCILEREKYTNFRKKMKMKTYLKKTIDSSTKRAFFK
jgi:hypothetical protein